MWWGADVELRVGLMSTQENLPEASPYSLDTVMAEDCTRFINRELSWLAFNERVLEEADNPNHPLLERLRFLSICAVNLDEFYTVRVAGIRGQIAAGVQEKSQDGLTPVEQLEQINTRAGKLMKNQLKSWGVLRHSLRDAGIVVLDGDELTADELEFLEDFFLQRVFPLLTPIAVDPAHPFPFIPNLGFALVLELKRRDDSNTFNALVPLTRQIERFIKLPGSN